MDLLRNLFNTLYFPSKVVNEYSHGAQKEPHRQWLIDKLRPENGFFRLCTSYDSILLANVQGYKGIDAGEAETFAQLRRVDANIIISDDKEFIAALQGLDPTIKIYSTLHILCWLSLAGLLKDWESAIVGIHRIRKFKSAELRRAYEEVLFANGLSKSKKEISRMCSISKWVKRGINSKR